MRRGERRRQPSITIPYRFPAKYTIMAILIYPRHTPPKVDGEEYGEQLHIDISQYAQVFGVMIGKATPQSLRFLMAVNTAKYEKEGKTVIEYGGLALPRMYLDVERLEIGKTYLYNGKNYKPSVIKATKTMAQENGFAYFSIVLMNMPENMYEWDITARAYVKYTNQQGETITEYSDDGGDGTKTQYASLYSIAEKYVSDPEANRDDVEILNGIFGME